MFVNSTEALGDVLHISTMMVSFRSDLYAPETVFNYSDGTQ